MASVTGMTAEAIDAALDTMIVGITVDSVTGEMFAHPRNGDPISAGPVIAPKLAIEKVYPIGAIFIATVATNPYDLLGIGTWIRYGQGRMIVSQLDGDPDFGGIGVTGGEKTHVLTESELASHSHSIPEHFHTLNLQYVETGPNGGTATRVTDIHQATGSGGTTTSATTDAADATNTGTKGDGAAHNNLPPYIVTYVWKRTA